MLSESKVAELLGHYAGWDAEDIDRIVAPLANDVVFSSPFVQAVGQGGDDRVIGKTAVRQYMLEALKRIPGIGYKVDQAYAGTRSLVIIWTARFPDGTERSGADTMQLNDAGAVIDLRAHYTWLPSEVLS